MKINENYPVRRVDIIINSEECDRYSSVSMDFIKRGISIRSLRSGPEVDENHRVVPDSYHMVLDIDEEHADELLTAIVGEVT